MNWQNDEIFLTLSGYPNFPLCTQFLPRRFIFNTGITRRNYKNEEIFATLSGYSKFLIRTQLPSNGPIFNTSAAKMNYKNDEIFLTLSRYPNFQFAHNFFHKDVFLIPGLPG